MDDVKETKPNENNNNWLFNNSCFNGLICNILIDFVTFSFSDFIRETYRLVLIPMLQTLVRSAVYVAIQLKAVSQACPCLTKRNIAVVEV